MLLEQERAGRRVLNIPGGRVESGETPGETAVRELKEETNLDIRLGELVGIVQGTWTDGGQFAKYVYEAERVGGEERAEKEEVIHWVESTSLFDASRPGAPVFELDAGILRDFVSGATRPTVRHYRCEGTTFFEVT